MKINGLNGKAGIPLWRKGVRYSSMLGVSAQGVFWHLTQKDNDINAIVVSAVPAVSAASKEEQRRRAVKDSQYG
jgi:hypothetical protein